MPLNYAEYLKASNGVGEAVRANVVVAREPGSAEINVDSILNWPQKFLATSGTLDASTGTFAPDTITVFYGHLSGSYLEIDEYAPGYSDTGNAMNEIIVIKPSTPWADKIAAYSGDGAYNIDGGEPDTLYGDINSIDGGVV